MYDIFNPLLKIFVNWCYIPPFEWAAVVVIVW